MTPIFTYPFQGLLGSGMGIDAKVHKAFGAVPWTKLTPFRSVA